MQAAPTRAANGVWWLNWATVRGGALVVAGIAIIVSPQQERMASSVAALLLVLWAVGELWSAVARPVTHDSVTDDAVTQDSVTDDGVTQGAAEATDATQQSGESVTASAPHAIASRFTRGVVAVGFLTAAILLLLDEVSFSVVIGGVFLLQGLSLLVMTPLGSDSSRSRKDHIVSGVVLVALGGLTLLVPTTAILAVRAGLGVGSMALGGVLIAMGLRPTDDPSRLRIDRRSAPNLLNDWLLRRRLGSESRVELVDALFFEPPKRAAKLGSFWVMMVLATGIATFAVIQDSTAVVIGAMLVAPLMTPIMGVAAAAVNGWAARLVRSIVLVVFAAMAAVAVAWLIAGWLPSVGDIATNSQIASRVEPALLDFCIAILAGAAGAYATVDPRVSSSLSGVAIAVALVPPLSVVGITLQQRAWEEAFGASLLFLTNVVSIVLAAVTVFVLMGFAALPPDEDQRNRMRRVVGVFTAGALVILIPLSFTSQDIWTEATDEAETSEVVREWLPEDGDVDLVRVKVEGESIEIDLTGPAIPDDTDSLVAELDERLGYEPSVSIRIVTAETRELN